MTRLPPVLGIRELPLAELHAARLDGELFPIDDAFSPIDGVDSAGTRALAFAAGFERSVTSRFIVERRTAAWIWGAVPVPPDIHQLCVATGARARVIAPLGLEVREVVIDDDEIIRIAGVAVTSRLRTVIDLVRAGSLFDSDDADAVRALMHAGRFSLDECARALDKRRNLPFKRRAWHRLLTLYGIDAALIAAQPELTR